MATICTTSLTFNNSTFCPHSVFMCFVWIWEQTAIISLYSFKWLVFITETECVYCAVRSTFYVLPTQCIYVFCVNLRTNSNYFTVQHYLTGVTHAPVQQPLAVQWRGKLTTLLTSARIPDRSRYFYTCVISKPVPPSWLQNTVGGAH